MADGRFGGLFCGGAYYTSLALDSTNVPYVAYRDEGNSNKATVMKFEGGSWQTVGSAGFSAGEADYPSLALDSNNVPYVAYQDVANSNKATVMVFAGGSWQTVGSAGFSAGGASYLSLAMDSNDVPFVAYNDDANSNKATVMKFSGGSWQTVGSAGFSADTVGGPSLALDSNNTPYVAYTDGNDNNKATVMKFEGGTWQTVGSAGFSADWADHPSLALDSNNVPYVAYEDFSNSGKATVWKFEVGSWQTVGSAGFSAGYAYDPSLALDSNNVPYVAYMDRGNSYKATVMKFEGGSWQTVGSAGFSAGRAYDTSLALDSNDVPYVAYMDYANSYKATVMKYSAGTAPTVSIVSIETLNNRRVNATLSDLGSPASVTAHGIVYNTTGTPTTSDSKVDKGATTTTGAYTVGLDEMNLTSGTKYYVRAFATNATSTAYGDELVVYGTPGSFTMTAPANNATGVSTSPTLSWSASTGATDYEYCAAAQLTDCTSNMTGPNWHSTGGATSVNLSGLLSGTTYQWAVRAVVGTPDSSYKWATNAPSAFTTAASVSANRLVLLANGSQDGWMLESSETSETGGTVDSTSTVLFVGDDASDRQYRSVISFDTSSLPDTAVITQAVLSFRINEVVGGGNLIKAFNYFMADVTSGWFGSTSSLTTQDFGFSPTLSSGPLNAKNVGGWYYLDLKTGKTAINTTGITQIRLRFNLGDNDNGIENIIKIYSGNSAIKPQLSIWYYSP